MIWRGCGAGQRLHNDLRVTSELSRSRSFSISGKGPKSVSWVTTGTVKKHQFDHVLLQSSMSHPDVRNHIVPVGRNANSPLSVSYRRNATDRLPKAYNGSGDKGRDKQGISPILHPERGFPGTACAPGMRFVPTGPACVWGESRFSKNGTLRQPSLGPLQLRSLPSLSQSSQLTQFQNIRRIGFFLSFFTPFSAPGSLAQTYTWHRLH